MYKLIVADDEAWIRERLACTIDWEKIGVEIVGQAENGEEALRLVDQYQPELLLTDIRMPGIDGLNLIETMRTNGYATKIVIISGYSDFEYAKKAIALGASGYLLKPVSELELVAVVQRCLDELRNESNREELVRKADMQVNRRLPMIKEMVFQKLVEGDFDRQQMTDSLEDFQLRNTDSEHACLVLQLRHDGGRGHAVLDQFGLFVLRNLVRDLLMPLSWNEIVFPNGDEVVCILTSSPGSFSPPSQQLEDALAELRFVAVKIMNCPIVTGWGVPCSSLLDISSTYRKAKQLLLLGYHPNENQTSSKRYLGDFQPGELEALINSIQIRDKDSTSQGIDDLFERKAGVPLSDMKYNCLHLFHSVARMREGNRWEDLPGFGLRFLELLQKARTSEELRMLVNEMSIKWIELLARSEPKKIRKIIDKAVVYVQEHYAEPIGLQVIADKLFLNASYFSKIFKDEMGIPFSKYVTEFRMERASALLKDPTRKIYEIAMEVGYDDIPYFTKTFKSIKGVTPVQYREN